MFYSYVSFCSQGEGSPSGGLTDRDPLDRDPPLDKPHLCGKEWVVCILLDRILILQFFFAENCMIMKELVPAIPPLDPPMLETKFSKFLMVFLQ